VGRRLYDELEGEEMESMMDAIMKFYDIIGEVILLAFGLLLDLIILLPIIILAVVALCFAVMALVYLWVKLADFVTWICKVCRREVTK
jgi:hypothetical protein